MARVFILIVAAVIILALVDGYQLRKGGKDTKDKKDKKDKKGGKVKDCGKCNKQFEGCLKSGYDPRLTGCTKGSGKPSKKAIKKCRKAEKCAVMTCGYRCGVTEPPTKPPTPVIEPTTKEPTPVICEETSKPPTKVIEPETRRPPPVIEPERPFDMNCKKDGLDYAGADIRDFTVEAFEVCVTECVKQDGCKAVTFRPSDNNCWLKNKNGGENGPSENAGLISMNLKCDMGKLDDSCHRDNKDFPGTDINSFQAKGFRDCASKCRDTEKCQSFSFQKSDNYCWLKEKRGGSNGPKPDNNRVSMNIDCAVYAGFDPADRTCSLDKQDMWGADMSDFKSADYADCRTSCKDTAGCLSYVWRKSDHNCWLKHKRGGENGVPTAHNDLISTYMPC